MALEVVIVVVAVRSNLNLLLLLAVSASAVLCCHNYSPWCCCTRLRGILGALAALLVRILFRMRVEVAVLVLWLYLP